MPERQRQKCNQAKTESLAGLQQCWLQLNIHTEVFECANFGLIYFIRLHHLERRLNSLQSVLPSLLPNLHSIFINLWEQLLKRGGKGPPHPPFFHQCLKTTLVKTRFYSLFSYLLAVFHLLFMTVNVGVCNERLGVWRRDEAALLRLPAGLGRAAADRSSAEPSSKQGTQCARHGGKDG